MKYKIWILHVITAPGGAEVHKWIEYPQPAEDAEEVSTIRRVRQLRKDHGLTVVWLEEELDPNAPFLGSNPNAYAKQAFPQGRWS